MNARKWLWSGLVALCAFVAILCCLARPYDPYAAFRNLGATEESHEDTFTMSGGHGAPYMVRTFHFIVPVSRVEAVLPRHATFTVSSIDDFTLPGGEQALLVRPGRHPSYPFLGTGDTCMVQVIELPPRPWYVEAWRAFRGRVGL